MHKLKIIVEMITKQPKLPQKEIFFIFFIGL